MSYSPEGTLAKILVIDSEQNDRYAIDSALRRVGYEVILAANGDYGLNQAVRERPDLIVMNVQAARRSGFLVLEELRMTETVPTRVVVLSSNPSAAAKNYMEQLGVDAYMTKPFVMTDLISTIERVLKDEQP